MSGTTMIFVSIRRVSKTNEGYCYLYHVCSTVRMEQVGSRCTYFCKFYMSVFLNLLMNSSLLKIQQEQRVLFTRTPVCIYDSVSLNSS
jgi:hypothetical protein